MLTQRTNRTNRSLWMMAASLLIGSFAIVWWQPSEPQRETAEASSAEDNGLSGPLPGYPDTVDAGRNAALRDLAMGRLKIGLWGDLDSSVFERAKAAGLDPAPLGCIIGGYGTRFWHGYNSVVKQTSPYNGFWIPDLEIDEEA
jgi:hypothetical protein